MQFSCASLASLGGESSCGKASPRALATLVTLAALRRGPCLLWPSGHPRCKTAVATAPAHMTAQPLAKGTEHVVGFKKVQKNRAYQHSFTFGKSMLQQESVCWGAVGSTMEVGGE